MIYVVNFPVVVHAHIPALGQRGSICQGVTVAVVVAVAVVLDQRVGRVVKGVKGKVVGSISNICGHMKMMRMKLEVVH